jgi:hypothetical protein
VGRYAPRRIASQQHTTVEHATRGHPPAGTGALKHHRYEWRHESVIRQSTPPSNVIRVSRNLLRVCTALGVAALALSGCGHKSSGGTSGGTGAFGAGQASASASAGGSGALGAGSPAPTRPSTADSGGAPGPRIVSFTVKQHPQCAIVGTSAAPYSQPEKPVVLAWKVTGASGIALSIDDPNFFKKYHSGSWHNYGQEGTVELPFPCTDTTRQSTTHTYTLDTLGDNSKEKTISVTAQNP